MSISFLDFSQGSSPSLPSAVPLLLQLSLFPPSLPPSSPEGTPTRCRDLLLLLLVFLLSSSRFPLHVVQLGSLLFSTAYPSRGPLMFFSLFAGAAAAVLSLWFCSSFSSRPLLVSSTHSLLLLTGCSFFSLLPCCFL